MSIAPLYLSARNIIFSILSFLMASSVFAEHPTDEYLYDGQFFTCVSADLDVSEQKILDAYLAFYGRIMDVKGFAYWSETLKERNGNLDVMLNAFASSDEFNLRFGAMNETELVINLYQQMFDRMPEETGLEYYVNKLETGSGSLQSIALDIFYGARNDDLVIRDNRRAFSEHYYKHVKTSGGHDLNAEETAIILSAITTDAGADDQACFNLMKRFPGTPQTKPVGEFRTTLLFWLHDNLQRIDLDEANQDFQFEYLNHTDITDEYVRVNFATYYKGLLVNGGQLTLSLEAYEDDGHDIWYIHSVRGSLSPVTGISIEPEILLEEITAIASTQYGVRVDQLVSDPQLVIYNTREGAVLAWIFIEADRFHFDTGNCEFVFNGMTGELIFADDGIRYFTAPEGYDSCRNRVSK